MNIPWVNAGWGSGGEALAHMLSELGIRCIFSLAGSQVLPVLDSIPRVKNVIRLVIPRSECAAAFMAEGFGQAAAFPAVVMSTLGPGVANELVGLYSALSSGSPLLSITPYQPPDKYDRIEEAFQGLEHPVFLEKVCKRTFLVETLPDLFPTIQGALSASLEKPCGPVHVDISFPLLFRRSFFRKMRYPPKERPRIQEPLDHIVVLEDKEKAGLPDQLGSDWIKEGRTLSPGVRGFGLPFSLGVKLALQAHRAHRAHQDGPVYLLTNMNCLMRHLDTLSVGKIHNVPMKIISLDGTGRGEDIAGLYGIPFERAKTLSGRDRDSRDLHVVLS